MQYDRLDRLAQVVTGFMEEEGFARNNYTEELQYELVPVLNNHFHRVPATEQMSVDSVLSDSEEESEEPLTAATLAELEELRARAEAEMADFIEPDSMEIVSSDDYEAKSEEESSYELTEESDLEDFDNCE